jgi:hypothetical protein
MYSCYNLAVTNTILISVTLDAWGIMPGALCLGHYAWGIMPGALCLGMIVTKINVFFCNVILTQTGSHLQH